jgi:hypothetical protein
MVEIISFKTILLRTHYSNWYTATVLSTIIIKRTCKENNNKDNITYKSSRVYQFNDRLQKI